MPVTSCILLLQVTEVLLQQGKADPNQPDREGYCPAHVAAQWGHAEVIAVLHQHGADVSLRNQDGFTAREIAEEWSRSDCAALLASLQPAC